MVQVKSVGVLSVGIIWGILSAVGGLIVGLLWAGMFSIFTAFTESYSGMYGEPYGMDEAFGPLSWMLGGLAIIIWPVLYGVIGFISGIIGAALYNLFAKWVGGIKVELQQETTTHSSV